MTGPHWPCWQCGAAGVGNLANRGYCATHRSELLASFSSASWDANGVGVIDGAADDTLGPSVYRLRCTACQATWYGVPGARCDYCRRHREHLAAAARAQVLTVPDDVAGVPYDVTLTAWGERLRRAVDARIITRYEAERAYREAVRHAHAS